MKFKNLFLKWGYNDTYKDFFKYNKEKINILNSSALNTLNNVAVFIFGIFCIYGSFTTKFGKIYKVYLIFLTIFLAINILLRHVQKHGYILPSMFLYLEIAILYIFGIYIGCFNLPNLTTVMYPVFVICLPLLFVLPTLKITIFTLAFTFVYIYFAKILKLDSIFFVDAINIIACSLISAITSYTVTCARLKEISVNMKLEHACNTDELTGLHNRRSFNNFIVNIFNISDYNNLTLMMIDIDNFKDYNDTYGHIYGDNCLATIGKAFLEFEEKYECYISRYGGEEFVLVDYKHTISEEKSIANDLIKMISDMNIENINSKYKKITISIGISSKSTSKVESYIDLINLADDALYQAKNNGKNTIMFASHSVYANNI